MVKQKIFIGCFLTFLGLGKMQGQNLPEFSLVSLTGDTISNKTLSGKLVYINIWETYCKPCIEEIPVLNKLKENYPNAIFLAVTPASKSKTAKFVKKYPFSFPVIYNATEFVSRLKRGGYPTHILISKEGKVSITEGSIRINPQDGIPKEELVKQLFDANFKRLSAFIDAGSK